LFVDKKNFPIKKAAGSMPGKEDRPLSEVDEHLPEWARIILDLADRLKHPGEGGEDGSR
jgi:hypothetical protein